MSEHIVSAYDKELEVLGRKIAEMGGIAETMLADAMDALSGMNVDLAQSVVASDPRLDMLQREIVAAIRISGDLERVGDLAKNIARRALKVAAEPGLPRATVGLKHMNELAALQLKDVLDAYAQRDVERVRAVWSRDADLDALEDSVFRDLLTFMMEDPRNISFCAHLLFCSKNIERVGDHTTNIAETVFYLVTGESLPMDRPKGRNGGLAVAAAAEAAASLSEA